MPGFYRVDLNLTWKDSTRNFSRVVSYKPEEMSVVDTNTPNDFASFWQKGIDEVNKLPVKFLRKTKIKRKDAKTDLYEVYFESVDGLELQAWLEMPKKKGKYPALLRLPGYTETLYPLDQYEDLIVFSVHVRDHGGSDNSGKREYEMWVRGLESPETFYYKNIYLDCLRAMNMLVSIPEVDQTRLAVWGGSQGGGLSLFTTAYDDRVKLCIADIPFLCDWEPYFELSHWPEVDGWLTRNPNSDWNSVLNVLSYFDTKNMADRINVPVWMGIGLQDDVCPPRTSFSTYNLIDSPKEYIIYPDEFHWQPEEHYKKRFKQLRVFFDMD